MVGADVLDEGGDHASKVKPLPGLEVVQLTPTHLGRLLEVLNGRQAVENAGEEVKVLGREGGEEDLHLQWPQAQQLIVHEVGASAYGGG